MADARSAALVARRLFGLNELVVATLFGLGYVALQGHVLAAAAFVWYAALFVIRS
jgi:hypothetical protein